MEEEALKLDINGLRSELPAILKGSTTKVLFQSRPVLNQHLNYDLLRFFLKGDNGNGRRGVMLNFCRSHLFMSQLLKKRRVSADGLVFIDALYNISGDSRKFAERAIILPCPFSKDFEDQLFEALGELEKVDFIVIDDIAALQNYWDRERIEAFLDRLSKNLALLEDPPLAIVADMTKDEWVLEAACGICHKVIEINGIKMGKARGSKERMLSSSQQ